MLRLAGCLFSFEDTNPWTRLLAVEIYSCAKIVNIFFERMELCREVYKEMPVSVFWSPFKNSSFTVKGICKRLFYFLAAGIKKVDKHLFKSAHMLEYNKSQNIQVLVNPQQTWGSFIQLRLSPCFCQVFKDWNNCLFHNFRCR